MASSVLPTTHFGCICAGVVVKVKQDISPGNYLHGGLGFIIKITDNSLIAVFTVKYNDLLRETSRHSIGHNQFKILPNFFQSNIESQPKIITIITNKKGTTKINDNTIDNRISIELLTYAISVGRKES